LYNYSFVTFESICIQIEAFKRKEPVSSSQKILSYDKQYSKKSIIFNLIFMQNKGHSGLIRTKIKFTLQLWGISPA
jgi:hypothetical protein